MYWLERLMVVMMVVVAEDVATEVCDFHTSQLID